MKLYRARVWSGDRVYRQAILFDEASLRSWKGYWGNLKWLTDRRVTVEVANVHDNAWDPYDRDIEKLTRRIHTATPEELEEFQMLVNRLAAEITHAEIDHALRDASSPASAKLLSK